MIDLRNKEIRRIFNRELQATFAVVGADLPHHLLELIDRLREFDDTIQRQGASFTDNSSSKRTRRL
jgi:hypothetical protein